MTIASANIATISGNGPSIWVKIPSDADNVFPSVSVGNANNAWGGSTVATLEYCPDATQQNPIVSPVKKEDTAVTFSANGNAAIENVRGFLRINVADYAGSEPISLHVV